MKKIRMPSALARPDAGSVLLSALSGAAYFLGFVGFGWTPLIFLCFVAPAVAVVSTERGWGWPALAFGTVTHLGGYYWIVHLLQTFGGLPRPLAALGYVLLCIFQGGALVLCLAFVRALHRWVGLAPGLALLPALACSEWIFPFLFPSYLGNALFEWPRWTQVADLGGVILVSVVVGAVNAVLIELWGWLRGTEWSGPRHRAVRLSLPALIVALATAYGEFSLAAWSRRVAEAPTVRTALVQINLGAKDKEEKTEAFILRHRRMSKKALAEDPDIDLFVWPESAYNQWVPRNLRNLAGITRLPRPVIFGALTFDGHDRDSFRRFNSVVATSSTGHMLGRFDKMELLLFGETLPIIGRFPKLSLALGFAGFTAGTEFSHLPVAGKRLLPMVCYEDVLPGFVRRFWREAGPADLLVNVTNDSWYGDSHEPLIHLALASFRSIETRRSLIRSTNTGISAVVDPTGRIRARTGQWTQEVLVDDVPVAGRGSTFYMKVGDWPAWLGTLVILAAWIRRRGGRDRD